MLRSAVIKPRSAEARAAASTMRFSGSSSVMARIAATMPKLSSTAAITAAACCGRRSIWTAFSASSGSSMENRIFRSCSRASLALGRPMATRSPPGSLKLLTRAVLFKGSQASRNNSALVPKRLARGRAENRSMRTRRSSPSATASRMALESATAPSASTGKAAPFWAAALMNDPRAIRLPAKGGCGSRAYREGQWQARGRDIPNAGSARLRCNIPCGLR